MTRTKSIRRDMEGPIDAIPVLKTRHIRMSSNHAAQIVIYKAERGYPISRVTTDDEIERLYQRLQEEIWSFCVNFAQTIGALPGDEK